MNNKVKYTLYTISVLILVFILGAGVYVYQKRQKVLKEGLRAQATVLSLSQKSGGRKKSGSYTAKLGVFLKGEKPAATPPPPVVPGKPRSTMDDIINNIGTTGPIGDYETVEITISGSDYEKLRIGQNVKVAYLPKQLDTVMLVDE